MQQHKKKGKGFQAPFFLHNNRTIKTYAKRASPVTLNIQKGSLTIEAAFVIPLFFLASIMLLSMVDMMATYCKTERKLHSLAREGCVAGILKEGSNENVEGDLLRIHLAYPVSPSVKGPGYRIFILENHCCVHLFNGYDNRNGDQIAKEETYVYVAKNGTVYHNRRSCKYINVSIRAVAGKAVKNERNQDRSKYYACPYCAGKLTKKQLSQSTVYITDYGERYHTKVNCNELKRVISVVPLSQAESLSPCSNCGHE